MAKTTPVTATKADANNITWLKWYDKWRDPTPFSVAGCCHERKMKKNRILCAHCVQWYGNGTGVLLHETCHKFVKRLLVVSHVFFFGFKRTMWIKKTYRIRWNHIMFFYISLTVCCWSRTPKLLHAHYSFFFFIEIFVRTACDHHA